MIVRTSMVFSPTTAKQRISQKKSGAFRRLDSGSPQQSEEGVQLLRGQQRSQTLLLQNCSSAWGWEPRKIESRNSEGETTMRNTPWNGLQTWRMVAKLGDFLRLPIYLHLVNHPSFTSPLHSFWGFVHPSPPGHISSTRTSPKRSNTFAATSIVMDLATSKGMHALGTFFGELKKSRKGVHNKNPL